MKKCWVILAATEAGAMKVHKVKKLKNDAVDYVSCQPHPVHGTPQVERPTIVQGIEYWNGFQIVPMEVS